MAAGPRRHRVTFQRATNTPTASGVVDTVWSTLWEAWARVSPVSGSESFIADRFRESVTHEVEIGGFGNHKSNPATTKDRITFVDAAGSTRILDILSVKNPDLRYVKIYFLAKEFKA